MATEDDDVVDAKLPEGNRASQPGRPRAHYCDFVESRLFRCLIPPPSVVLFAHVSFLSTYCLRFRISQNRI